MSGGTGEIAIPVWRNFSGVIQVNGEHTDHIPNFNVGLSLLTGLGGLRMRVPNHTRFQPYGEALFGGVHGFDSYFPARIGKFPTSYDTSFALAVGGGLDIAVSRHSWIRAIQADYHYSELRNLQGDRQNQFRLGQVLSSEVEQDEAVWSSRVVRITSALWCLCLWITPAGGKHAHKQKMPTLRQVFRRCRRTASLWATETTAVLLTCLPIRPSSAQSSRNRPPPMSLPGRHNAW